MEMEDQRRIYHNKRDVVGANTPLGHRYSNAIEHLQNLDLLLRNQRDNLDEIAELELVDML